MQSKGIVNNYLYYRRQNQFGIVAGTRSKCVLATNSHLLCPCCESVLVYDIRTLSKQAELRPHSKSQVSSIAVLANSTGPDVAIGYSDGALYVCVKGNEPERLFAHRSSIEALVYSDQTNILASGSKDHDIVIWDMSECCGRCKLRGHKDAVTHLQFIMQGSVLLSSSRDRTLRMWDVESHYCFQTVALSTDEILTFTCIFDKFLCVGERGRMSLHKLRPLQTSDQVSTAVTTLDAVKSDKENGTIDKLARFSVDLMGSLDIPSHRRVTQICQSNDFLTAHTNDRSVDIFKVQDPSNSQGSREQRSELRVEDVIVSSISIKSKSKIQGVCFLRGVNNRQSEIAVTTRANSIRFYRLDKGEFKLMNSVEGQEQCKFIDISHDEAMVITSDGFNIRVWNRSVGDSFRTIECDEAISSLAFLPNYHYVVAGSAKGSLYTISIVTKTIMNTRSGIHTDSVCRIMVYSNRVSLSTNSRED